jgi:FtsZ-interacting cell division protein ZipA
MVHKIWSIIAVVIVFIVVVLTVLVMKYYICKHNNTSKKNKTQNRRTNVNGDTGETSKMENDNEIELLRKGISKDNTKKDPIHATRENGEMNDSHGKKLSEKCLSPRDSDTNDTENESSKCLL